MLKCQVLTFNEQDLCRAQLGFITSDLITVKMLQFLIMDDKWAQCISLHHEKTTTIILGENRRYSQIGELPLGRA